MGRELVLKKIKSHGKKTVAGGILIMLLGLFMVFVFFATDDGAELFAILSLLLFAFGLVSLILGIKTAVNPEKSGFIKNNPDLLKQADELYFNIVYEDKYIIISNRVIANKKQITQMAYLEDIYLIYQRTQSMNLIPTANELVLENRNKKNSMTINIYAKGKNTRDDLFRILSNACPNARLGWTPENLQYLAEMRRLNNQGAPENMQMRR